MSNTLFVGKVYHRFEELPSTNEQATELISSSHIERQQGATKTKPPEGTVVRADNQTAGRGQLGSRWHSPPGENLLLSVILYPTWLEAQAQFYLSMATALALRDTVQAAQHTPSHPSPPHLLTPHPLTPHPLTLSPALKWPNDLYLQDKKTAGILIQNTLSGLYLQSSVIGIGLNVNQEKFPPDLPNATSLALVFGQKIDLDGLAEGLFECLERRYLQLKAGHQTSIKTEYEKHLWRRGIASRFLRNKDNSEFEGILLGVTERGLLRVDTGRGVEEFEIKELKFVV